MNSDYPKQDKVSDIQQLCNNNALYSASDDFNADGEIDLAVALIDTTRDHKNAIRRDDINGKYIRVVDHNKLFNVSLAIFNGPLDRFSTPVYLKENYASLQGAVLCKSKGKTWVTGSTTIGLGNKIQYSNGSYILK